MCAGKIGKFSENRPKSGGFNEKSLAALSIFGDDGEVTSFPNFNINNQQNNL